MSFESAPVLEQMQSWIDRWENAQDRRAIFLSCYSMMTRNMLIALENGEFLDAVWVNDLLHRFADYYFIALDAYDKQPDDSPAVWRLAFETCPRRDVHVLQHLMLGVNAHINYDLVYVIVDMLQSEWSQLSDEDKVRRYRDHCHVNEVIFRTINAVQDQVVERYSPRMDIIDKGMFMLDEWLLGQLIEHWREEVWQHAIGLMSCTENALPELKQELEKHTLQRGRSILLQNGILGLRHLL